MASFPPTYLYILFLFILAMAIGGLLNREKQKREKNNDDIEILPMVEALLAHINCQFKHDEKDNWHEYTFKYQNGNFILVCKEGDNNLRIHYPHFFTTTIDNIDIVREICNICNTHTFTHHIVYTTSGKDNAISLHITSSISIMGKEETYVAHIQDILSLFFNIAQEFYLRFEKRKDQIYEENTYDIEQDYLKYEREFFMLKEMEVAHGQQPEIERTSKDKALSLKQVLLHFFAWEQPEFLELKVITHELKTLVNEKDIADFDISKVIIALDANNQPVFIRTNATLVLTFTTGKQKDSTYPEQLTITLHNEGRTANVLYQRATITYVNRASHFKNPKMDKTNSDAVFSFVFAYDRLEGNPECEEARKIIENLKSESKPSGKEELHKDQLFIDRILHQDWLKICNYGVTLFREKRYYETIVELEYVYNYLTPLFQKFTQKEQNIFYELCYYIGFSYSEIGQYQKAYYYLDAIFQVNNLTYVRAYVNCLVNAKDFRSLSVIDNLTMVLRNQMKSNEESMPDNIRRFLNFLQRRKAHLYIDLGEYQKAKEIYEVLYHDPESQDYALSELAYLQSISEKDNGKKNSENNH